MNILITGSRSGIAFDLITKLVKNKEYVGYNIYATTHTEEERESLEELIGEYDNVFCFKLDITNQDDVKKIDNMDIDILIANAACCIGGSILDVPIEKVRENYEVNVFSNFDLIKKIANKMIEKDNGKIIIMGSLASLLPINFIGIYASTKSAIYMLSKTLSNEIKLLTNNVHIILIEPGLYHTGFNQVMIENKLEYMKNSKFKNKIDKIINNEKLMFDILEKNDTSSITNKIIEAIISNKPKFIYRAPITQVTFAKIYNFFKS